MHDWMISKRYWGTLPIWVCDNPACAHFEVIGDEEARAHRRLGKHSRPHAPSPIIDAVKQPPSLRRADDAHQRTWAILAERGQRGLFHRALSHGSGNTEAVVPADWIRVLPGQFRNWFYSLITMSTVFEQIPPTKIVHGYSTLWAEDGRPMHKSWGNAIWFDDAAEQMGVDTMRWMYLNQKLDQNMLFGYTGADEVRRRFLIPLWNVYAFFVNYARIDGWTPPAGYKQSQPVEEGAPTWAPWTQPPRRPCSTNGSSPGCARRCSRSTAARNTISASPSPPGLPR